ncbi:MAG: hypothetical protein SV598_00900 [Pseudomonadota bacterium]|nr:hypothetical protein [Pseudomonadota bacterium]
MIGKRMDTGEPGSVAKPARRYEHEKNAAYAVADNGPSTVS